MSRKPEIINLMYGSILGGSLMLIWIGIVETYMPKAEVIAWLVLITIGLCSVLLTQRYYQRFLKPSYFLAVISVSFLALFSSLAFQTREIWRFFLLPAGFGIAAISNLIVYFIRTKLKKKAETKEMAPMKSLPLGFNIAAAVIVFIMPVVLSLYMRFFMPPRVELSSPRIVVYDYLWKGNEDSEKGLYAYCPRGKRKDDYGYYDWIVAAYLVSREWYDSPEEPWKDEEYVRRARFYSTQVKSFDRNERRDFEVHRCFHSYDYYPGKDGQFREGLFLPYHIIRKGVNQGDFGNYKPEPLNDLISSSDKVQFAIEYITVVSSRRGKRAVEGEYGKHRKKIVLLDEKATLFAGPYSGEERYFDSEWHKMVSGLTEGPTITEEKEIVSPSDEEKPTPKRKETSPEDIKLPKDLGEL
jgi:hypothetical protein